MEFTIEELDVELCIVTDDHGAPQPLDDFISYFGKQPLAGELLIGKSICARGPQRQRTFRIQKHLDLLLDAFPLCENNAHFADTITKPGRKSRCFEVEKGKTGTGNIKHVCY